VRVVWRLGLAVLSFVVVFGLFELILFATGFESPLLHFGTPRVYRADDELIYSLRPGGALDTNSIGLRGPEVAASARGPRLIALGDSYTYGHGLEYPASYPALLQDELVRRGTLGTGTEVVNAGTPGYNVDQAYALFVERLQALGPDWVLLAIEPKDLAGANVLFDLEGGELVRVPAWKNWIYLQLKLRTTLPEWLQGTRVFGFLAGRLTGSDFFRTLPSSDLDSQIQWQLEKIRWMVADLVERGREDGFEVLVIHYPDRPALVHGGDYRMSSYFELPVQILGPRGNEHMDRLAEVIVETGAHSVDGMKIFLDRESDGTEIDSLFLAADPHMNERGNRMLAGIVADALARPAGRPKSAP